MKKSENQFYVMLCIMKTLISSAVMLLFLSNSYAAEAELLHANEWSVPKQSTTILAMPAIHKSMSKLQKNVNSVLKLKYPGGDEGTLWVNELRSWLIALGLSSSRIELVQGSAISTTIELEVLFN